MRAALLLCLVCVASAVPVHERNVAFRYANTFGNHMVLQQAPAKANIWGFGTPGAPVKVESTAGGMASTTVDEHGIWQVQLDPVVATSTPVNITATSGQEGADLLDVLYGDVWFCSGQSNMQFTVATAFNATEEIRDANNFPEIRLFSAALVASLTPLTELQSVMQEWSVASNTSVGGPAWKYFSATCWFFGKETYKKRRYPIGLIDSDWGGTRDEAWSSPEALKVCNASIPSPTEGDLDSALRYVQPDQLGAVQAGPDPNTASVLWNAMVVPFLRTSIKGAVWYQGEANCGAKADTYKCTFPAMIDNWRTNWYLASKAQTSLNFPFGFVQLAAWNDAKNATCGDSACPVGVVRWGQTANYNHVPNIKMNNTFMAVAVDLGDPSSPEGDVHPRYKQQVGARLALAGQAIAYEQAVYWTGPLAQSASLATDSVTVVFCNEGAQGIQVKHGVGFEILQNGHWIETPVIQHQKNSVTVAAGANTTAVRYNFYQAACMPEVGIEMCAIYALEEGLPAPPFVLSL